MSINGHDSRPLNLNHFRGCLGLCELQLEAFARTLERDGITADERWEIGLEIDLLRDAKHALQLMVDLLERKRREDAGMPSFWVTLSKTKH